MFNHTGVYTFIFYAPVSKDRAYSFWHVRMYIYLSVCKTLAKTSTLVSDMAFIFHMCVPYDGAFLFGQEFFTFWPWSLTYLPWPYILNGFHISYVCSLWQDRFIGTIIFYLTMTLNFDLLFKNFNIGHIFWMVSDIDIICVFLMIRFFYWDNNFWPPDLQLEVLPTF
jgi:hypothetical protein